MNARGADPDVRADAPGVSVIIPHLNQLDALVRCLASIDGQWPSDRLQVIVVDNGSRVDLSAMRAARPDVTWLHEATPGPGPARNRGVAAARHDMLLFIDADCRAERGWIAAAVRALARSPDRALIGGDVRIAAPRPERLTPLEAYESVFAYRQRMYIEKQNFSGTGNLGMWRAVHQAVGPFVGLQFAEDREWGRRAATKGYRVAYVPDMVIYHPARARFSELEAKWRRHVAHDWADHVAAGRSKLRWLALAGATAGSGLIDSWRLFASPRLSGIGNRARGLAILWRIRAFRAAEMLRVVNRDGSRGSMEWNRVQ